MFIRTISGLAVLMMLAACGSSEPEQTAAETAAADEGEAAGETETTEAAE